MVAFADFNEEVLQNATKPVIEMNCPEHSAEGYCFKPGAWEQLC